MATAAERNPAKRFVQWLNNEKGSNYVLSDGPNPPDFYLESSNGSGWLEVSDAFLDSDQAKFLNLDKLRSYPPRGDHGFLRSWSIDQTALAIVHRLKTKVSKSSYKDAFNSRGPGLLLLVCRDFFFDEVNLSCVEEVLPGQVMSGDLGFFSKGYLEYRLTNNPVLYYRLIYPPKT